MFASQRRAAIGTILLIGAMAALSTDGSAMTLFFYILLAFTTAASVLFVLGWFVSVRVARKREMFRDHVWWQFLVAGRTLPLIAASCVAIGTGGAVALGFVTTPGFILWFGSTALLSQVIARRFVARTARPLKPYAAIRVALWFGGFVSAAGMTAVWLFVMQTPVAATFGEQVGAQARYTGSSALLGQLTDMAALWSGGRGWAAGRVASWGVPTGLILLAQVLGTFGAFWGMALVGLAPLLFGSEAHRVLRPTLDTPPAPASALTIGLVSGGAVIGVLILMSEVAGLEQQAAAIAAYAPLGLAQPQDGTDRSGAVAFFSDASSPPPDLALSTRPLRPLDPSAFRQQVEAEKVGALTCPLGTIGTLTELDTAFRVVLDAQQGQVAAAAHTGFDLMRTQVPAYLDWYYSLSAEYLRTANLLVGNGEAYMLDRMDHYLSQGDPFARLEATNAVISETGEQTRAYLRARYAEMAKCSDLPSDTQDVRIVQTAPEALSTTGLHLDHFTFDQRLRGVGIGGVAGATAGAIVAKVGLKAISGTAFKMAVAALTKIAGTKALTVGGGVLVGAGGGAAAGTVVPGAGTTAGAFVGGIAGGVLVMLGVDFTMIKLEEQVSRDAFAADIYAAIDSAEAEFLTQIGLSQIK